MSNRDVAVQATVAFLRGKGVELTPGQREVIDSRKRLVWIGAKAATHRIETSIGGFDLGRSFCAVPWMIERGLWDTANHHLYVNARAEEQFTQFSRLLPELVWGRRPPQIWVREWRLMGVPRPVEPQNYRRIITFRTGLSVVHVSGRMAPQCTSLNFGSVFIDDASVNEERFGMLAVRVRRAEDDDGGAIYLVGPRES